MQANQIEQDERALAATDDALAQVQVSIDLAKARLSRLFATAFENGPRAMQSALAMRQKKSVEFVVAALNNETALGRVHYFGFMRGEFFARGSRQQARESLLEIPEALRDFETLAIKRVDLMTMRFSILDRLDRSRLNARRQEGHTSSNDRPRPRGM